MESRLVVVTGVARAGQLGEHLARAFAERGDTVVAVDRDAAELRARVGALAGEGLAAHAVPCDLTSEVEAAALASEVRRLGSGRLDALVNAAGGFAPSGPVAESDPAIWGRMRAINHDTAYLATRALLPLLRHSGGAIVFFSAAAALPGGSAANLSAYVAAKSAVLALMRSVVAEERNHGVRANAVAPTAVRTAQNVDSMGEDARYVEREEVAELVLYLCSPQARSVNGQVVRLG